MQNVQLQRQKRQWRSLLILLGILAGIAGAVFLIVTLVSNRPVTKVTANRLPCEYNDSIKPFGSNVLYYDGVSIHCMSNTGAVRWSFQLGASAGFDCTDDVVAAWAGNTIYIIDENGNSTYNDNLGEPIQFARAGKQYVAAVIGDSTTPAFW
jgi:hypothetical protein